MSAGSSGAPPGPSGTPVPSQPSTTVPGSSRPSLTPPASSRPSLTPPAPTRPSSTPFPGAPASLARKPFAAALSGELLHLEELTVRAWQAIWSVALVASLGSAVLLDRRIGLAWAIASAAALAAHVVLGRRIARAPRSATIRTWLVAVESSSPWLLFVVLAYAAGSDYALASWAPPMLFCGLVVAFTARLEPQAALLTGVGSALAYTIAYFALVRPGLTAEASAQITFQVPMQIFRALSLAAGGAMGMLAARGLRAAFERADTTSREQDLYGRYQLAAPIASGGMGIVYDAVYQPQGGFARRVALKRIHEHLADKPRFVDAFRAEAELCARLTHPNVVQVVDFGRVGGSYFLAMEFVDGLTLSALARRATGASISLPPHVVARIGQQLLSGLEHAHSGARDSKGRPLRIVHRDVCPENVLVSQSGEVKLTDFGVARALRDAAAAETRAAGHIAYMAPEQARGEAVDLRADVFAVGVVLWELVAGRRLFLRDNEPATLVALLSEPIPPVTALREDVDRAWDSLFARALARSKDERFGSAAEMSEALEAIAGAGAERADLELAALVERLREVPEPCPPVAVTTVTSVD